jgi:hypothetical protein
MTLAAKTKRTQEYSEFQSVSFLSAGLNAMGRDGAAQRTWQGHAARE